MITHRFTTFDPSLRLQRRDPVRAVLQFCWMRGLPFGPSRSPAAPLNFLSCGFPKNAPPLTYTVRVLSRLSLERAFLRLCAAKHRAPSVHVVPPDFDGFLRELRCRFVSSCSQPWGSSCFCRGLPPPVFPQQLVLHAFLRLAPHTLQSFSLSDSCSASPRRRCLLVVGLHICFQCASLDLKALLHRRVRCPLVMSPSPDFSMLSWALFPFKALPSFRLPIWTSPESFRLSGTTLGHVHRSGRALNVAAAEATA